MTLKTIGPRLATFDPRKVKPLRTEADPTPYLTAEWRALMRHLIKERGRRCQDCYRTHNDATGQPIRIYGDHIRELRDGGAFLDPANVRLRCGSCHTKKTLSERAKRAGLTEG